MPFKPDTLRVNNATYSWNSCSTTINNFPFQGILGIDFDETIERELVYAQTRANKPIARTEGKYTPTLKITMLRDTFLDSFVPLLRAQGVILGGVGWGRVEFQTQLQYTHRQIGTHTIDFVDCVVAKQSQANQQGIEAAKTELEISLMDILLDGFSMASAGLI